jgi:hypothetical protein
VSAGERGSRGDGEGAPAQRGGVGWCRGRKKHERGRGLKGAGADLLGIFGRESAERDGRGRGLEGAGQTWRNSQEEECGARRMERERRLKRAEEPGVLTRKILRGNGFFEVTAVLFG